MITGKRRHQGSTAVTPASSSDLRASSFARSTPTHQVQRSQQRQQRPVKRVTLHTPSSQRSSESPFPQRQHHVRHEPPIPLAEDDAIIREREDADSLNEIIMGVDMRERGKVGCCYYVAREQKLYLMADVAYGGIEVIETCEEPPPFSQS